LPIRYIDQDVQRQSALRVEASRVYRTLALFRQSDDISPVAGFFDLDLDVVPFDAACFAQRAFCARLILLRVAADIVRVPSDVEPLYGRTNGLSAAFNADNCSYSVPFLLQLLHNPRQVRHV
jgi:hypothetical protein